MDGIKQLGVDWKAIVLYIVNFGVLLFFLTRYLYNPLLKWMDDRRNLIKQSLEEAESLKVQFKEDILAKELETKKLVAQMQKELHESREKSKELAEKLLKEAEVEKAKILQAANLEAAEIKKDLARQAEEEIFKRVSVLLSEAIKNNTSPADVKATLKKAWQSYEEKERK